MPLSHMKLFPQKSAMTHSFHLSTTGHSSKMRESKSDSGDSSNDGLHSMKSFEERVGSQLERLFEMGFHDREENIQALRESDGDLDGAVAYLIHEEESSTTHE